MELLVEWAEHERLGKFVREGRDGSSIDVAKPFGPRVHNITDGDVAPQAISGDHRTQTQEGWGSSGVRRHLGRVQLPADTASSKRVLVA